MRTVLESSFTKYILLAVVFLTGASILILEILATRLLSVYFGNTIFTVSSVISIILFALSLGYYFGGRLADKKARESLFYSLILISGYAVLAIHLLNLYFIPMLSRSLSMREGPMAVAFLLFFFPSLLLGMLSPIVVVLQNKRNKEGIGKTSGDVFFWSTLGSIAGSLLCGYVLIPNFGIDRILVGVGIFLIFLAVIGLWNQKSRRFAAGLLVFTLLFLPILFVIFNFLDKQLKPGNIVFAKDGVYGKIVIYDGLYYGLKTRFLRQDLDESSAMFHKYPNHVYEYTKYYSLYKLQNPQIKNALTIGGGAYTVPKSLLNDSPGVIVDVAEIEPELFDIVKKYFKVPQNKRLINNISDGRRFLYETDKKYGLIFSDAYNFSIPFHLATVEFLKLSKEKLTTDGIFVMNIIGSTANTAPSYTLSQLRTFKAVYPHSMYFAIDFPQSDRKQNLIFVGFKNPPRFSDFDLRDSQEPFFRSLTARRIDIAKYDLKKHTLITDNYAPVDYLIALSL